jgi:hypothetical protein
LIIDPGARLSSALSTVATLMTHPFPGGPAPA